MSDLRCRLAFAGVVRHRPPLMELRVDVTLEVDADGPRWAVLPRAPAQPLPSPDVPRSIMSLSAYELGTPSARVAAVALLADPGAFAVPLPAGGGSITLRSVPFEHWGAVPELLAVSVVAATELLIDGAPLAERLRLALTAIADAEVDAAPLADQGAVVEALGGMERPALELSLVEPQVVRCVVAT